MSESGLKEFSFGEDDDTISFTTDKYKGDAGNTDRVSMVWWRDLDSDGLPVLGKSAKPRWVGGPRVFIKGVGAFFVPPSNKDLATLAKKAGEDPKEYAGTIIAVWPTDKNGALDEEAPRLHKVDVKPWIVSGDRYRALKRKHNNTHFANHDLLLSCTDSQWQKMDIDVCGNSLYLKIVEAAKDSEKGAKARAIVDRILDRIEKIEPMVGKLIANDWSADTVREKMGVATGNPDLGGAVSDANVDNMLGDLITPT